MYQIGIVSSSLSTNPAEAIKIAGSEEFCFEAIQLGYVDRYLDNGFERLQRQGSSINVKVHSTAGNFKNRDYERLVKYAQLGVPFSGHIGRIRNPNDAELIALMHAVSDVLEERNIWFGIETGEEEPRVLFSFLRKVNSPRIGVCFDAANFLIYKTLLEYNEIERALGLLERYVLQVHIKGAEFGTEKMLCDADNRVNIESYVRSLMEIGYKGHLLIEVNSRMEEKARLKAAKKGKEYLEFVLSNSL